MLDHLANQTTSDTGADWAQHARSVLGSAGHHRGAARDRLIDLLAGESCALSALEIEDGLRRGRRGHGPVGRASIYRVLELLHAHDLVNRLDLGDGIARYRALPPGWRTSSPSSRLRAVRQARRVRRPGARAGDRQAVGPAGRARREPRGAPARRVRPVRLTATRCRRRGGACPGAPTSRGPGDRTGS